MYDKKFYLKKQLLVQRDELLVDIGLRIFESGNLPKGFELMGKEFHSMDILVRQLEDRHQSLVGERERVHREDLELLSRKSKLEREYEKKLCGPRQDHDALSLKVMYQKDQLRKARAKGKGEESLPALEERARILEDEINTCQEELKAGLSELRAQWDPLQTRLNKLDKGILKVQNEMDHLKSNYNKKLRELAWHYFNRKLEKDRYGAQYDTLTRLRTELADNTRETRYVEAEINKVEEEGARWRGFLALVVAVLLIGWFFRTRFDEQQDSLAAIGAHFIPDLGHFRIFADLTVLDGDEVRELTPEFGELPAGDLVFKDLREEDIQHVLLARDLTRAPLFCGLKFSRPPPRFKLRLKQNGWNYLPTSNWLALSDEEGQWVWLVLNDREFFLFPKAYLAQFESLALTPGEERLRVNMTMPAFGNNHPLLQGYDQLSLVLKKASFQLEVFSNKPLENMDLRTRRLALLTGDARNELTFRLDDGRLQIAGPDSALLPDDFTVDGLKDFVESRMHDLENQHQWYPDETDQSQVAQVYTASPTNQRLMVMGVEQSQLRLLSEIRVGSDIQGLNFLHEVDSLLALDRGERELLRLKTQGVGLTLEDRLSFSAVSDGFEPHFMEPTPDEQGLAVVGMTPDGSPQLVFIQLEDMRVLQTLALPQEIREGLSLCWNLEGDALYVGGSPRKGRGDYVLAVVVYHKEGNVLRPYRFVDLPHEDAPAVQVSSLVWRKADDALYLYQSPQQKLVRYGLANMPAMDSLRFSVGRSNELFSHQLHLNRTRDHILIVGKEEVASDGDSFLYLTRLSDDGPVLADTADLGFTPFHAQRAPFTDQFWITGPQDRTLARIRIEEGKIKTELIQQMQWRPQLLAQDRWGSLLFVAGKVR